MTVEQIRARILALVIAKKQATDRTLISDIRRSIKALKKQLRGRGMAA